jgi:hypothetical protein
MNKVLESLKNNATRDFNNGVMSGYSGYAKIKIKNQLITCECKKAAGNTNRNRTRFNWFLDGKRVAFTDLLNGF